MPERPLPTPSRPSVGRRFARAINAHNATLRPAPVVLARALADVVAGREPGLDGGVDEGDERPRGVPSARRARRIAAPFHVRPARAVLSVVAVGVCVGAFAGPSPAAGIEAGMGSASMAAIVAVQSHAEESGGADSSSVHEVTGTVSPLSASSDSALRAALARRAAALRQRPVVPPGLPVGAPVAGVISSTFGPRRHPISGSLRGHRGTDFAVPLRTPVRATAYGRVLAVGLRPGYGLTVEVEHRDPSGLTTSTLYAHLDAAAVTPGVAVHRGGVVGLSGGVGPTAGLSTGPHVHYEVRERRSGGEAIDPSVLYDRVRVWRTQTARQRRQLATAVQRLNRARPARARDTDSVITTPASTR